MVSWQQASLQTILKYTRRRSSIGQTFFYCGVCIDHSQRFQAKTTMISYIRAKFFDQRFIIILFVVILATVGIMYRTNFIRFEIVQKEFRLDFIPVTYQVCEDIAINGSFHMSSMNQLKSKEFDAEVIKATGNKGSEGYSGQVPGEYLIMHHLAGQSAAKRICETGFNLGHSSFSYLTANENAIVHSFDLGYHGYAHHMAAYLKKIFPTRFFIHFGDSTKTVPEFIRENPGFQCDFMFVDGGHVYPVALADLKNFASIANLEGNIVAFDDYPTTWGQGFGKAWEDVTKAGIVKESMRCTFRQIYNLQRGFTLGRVMKRPTNEANASTKP